MKPYNEMHKKNRYLSVKKIEQIFGIEPQKVYWWVRDKKIVYAKIGKSVLIPEAQFKEFLEFHTIDKRQQY